jgi:hypothetical protein
VKGKRVIVLVRESLKVEEILVYLENVGFSTRKVAHIKI